MEINKSTWIWVAGIGILVLAIWYFGGKFFRKVTESIFSWVLPQGANNESDYKKSLASHLRKLFPKRWLLEESGTKRRKADITLHSSNNPDDENSEKYAIELKLKLSSNTELDRLVGQVMGYKEDGYDKTIIVSIDADPNFASLLENKCNIEGLNGFMVVIGINSNGQKVA